MHSHPGLTAIGTLPYPSAMAKSVSLKDCEVVAISSSNSMTLSGTGVVPGVVAKLVVFIALLCWLHNTPDVKKGKYDVRI